MVEMKRVSSSGGMNGKVSPGISGDDKATGMCFYNKAKGKERKWNQNHHSPIDQLFRTMSSIHAGPVLDTGIRMVLISKGVSMEIMNLKAKDVFIPIKSSPSPEILKWVYSPHIHTFKLKNRVYFCIYF